MKILSEKFPAEVVKWVAVRLDRNEFKRRQMAPGIKLSGGLRNRPPHADGGPDCLRVERPRRAQERCGGKSESTRH